MKSVILGTALAAAACAFAAIHPRSIPVAPSGSRPQSATPLRYSDLTMDRISRVQFQLVAGTPVSFQMPAALGLVVESIVGGAVSVTINGISLGQLGGAGGQVPPRPPLVFRPGDIVTFEVLGAPGQPFTCVLHGWNVFPGEV